MKICHDEKADTCGDKAEKFGLVIRGNAVSNVVCDGLVINSNKGAGNKNCDTESKPAEAKIPIHKAIIHLIL